MALKFTTTKQAAKISGVKVLVYGKAGSGKTRLCSTAPKPFIISAEAGLLSLRDYDIPAVEVSSIEDLEQAYTWVTTNKKAEAFETICLDSISEIAEIVLAKEKADSKDARQAYGALIDRMLKVIRQFRDLPKKNVYFSAKQSKIIDSISETVTFQPSMPGSKLGENMPYYFDEVFNLNVIEKKGEKKRVLRTSSNFQYEAKDRSGALDELEVAHLGKIFKKIKGVEE